MKKIAAAIRSLRQELNITQQDLAVRMGVALSTITRWESGVVPPPKPLAALARIAGESKRPDIALILTLALGEELEPTDQSHHPKSVWGRPYSMSERAWADAIVEIRAKQTSGWEPVADLVLSEIARLHGESEADSGQRQIYLGLYELLRLSRHPAGDEDKERLARGSLYRNKNFRKKKGVKAK